MGRLLIVLLVACSSWCEDRVRMACPDKMHNTIGWLVKERGVIIDPAEIIRPDGSRRRGVQIRRVRDDATITIYHKWDGNQEAFPHLAATMRVTEAGYPGGIFSCVLRDQVKAGDLKLAAAWLGNKDATKEQIIADLDRFDAIVEIQYRHNGKWADAVD